MEGKLVETLSLNNALKLEILDRSRITTGDRWLVRLVALADIPLRAEYFDSLSEKEFSFLLNALGHEIHYRFVREKHFFEQHRKDEMFQLFLKTFKENTLGYLHHPDFEKRFVLSRYRELKKTHPHFLLGKE